MLERPFMPESSHSWLPHTPTELQEILGDAAWEADDWGMSGTHIYRVGQRYLKILSSPIGFNQEQRVLAAEAARLQWLAERLPVPEVHYYGHDEQDEFLLISELSGIVSCDQTLCDRVPEVVRLLAEGLHMVHRVDISACPFDMRREKRLELARQYLAQGMIDATQFNVEFQGLSAQEVYELALQHSSFDEDLVFTHGDYCLPNILLDRQLNQVSGLLDWGRSGIADRYADLALAARSLARNFGEQWVPLLFAEYGLASPDQVKLQFYRALDEISWI